MAVCRITGKCYMNGNRVSHSNIKSKHKFKANVQKKRVYDVETGRYITLKLSTRALKMFSKKSVSEILAGIN
jgi:large subunit ribosomal protein L28